MIEGGGREPLNGPLQVVAVCGQHRDHRVDGDGLIASERPGRLTLHGFDGDDQIVLLLEEGFGVKRRTRRRPLRLGEIPDHAEGPEPGFDGAVPDETLDTRLFGMFGPNLLATAQNKVFGIDQNRVLLSGAFAVSGVSRSTRRSIRAATSLEPPTARPRVKRGPG